VLRALTFGAIVPAAVLEVIDGNVLDVVFLWNDRSARFEDKSFQAFFGKF
jgi:hypothetical protein